MSAPRGHTARSDDGRLGDGQAIHGERALLPLGQPKPRGAARARGSDQAFGIAFALAFAFAGAVAWLLIGETPAQWLFVVSGAFLVAAFLAPQPFAPFDARRVKLSAYPPYRFFVSGACAIARPPFRCCALLPPRLRRPLRIVWWNALLLASGLLLIAIAGEAWHRLNTPFVEQKLPTVFVDGVGLLRPPGGEVRITNGLDYWTISRANTLGFMDREPVSAERDAMNCRIAMIGDSFVEAKRVRIDEKFHVLLEKTPSLPELPGGNVSTAAYGFGGVGQVSQLVYYDHYARRLRPNIVTLVFAENDFADNHSALLSAQRGIEPGRIPFVSAQRNENGTWSLRLPNPDFSPLPNRASEPPARLRSRIREALRARSYFARWLFAKRDALDPSDREQDFISWAEAISRIPGYESFLDGWEPTSRRALRRVFEQEELPPLFMEALDASAFALDEFQRRAERDGAALVILATHTMGPTDDPLFQRLAAMAGERGIPVINQYDYIERVGGNVEDAHFKHDWHWSPQGHQWAAEALMEWIRENPNVCDDE